MSKKFRIRKPTDMAVVQAECPPLEEALVEEQVANAASSFEQLDESAQPTATDQGISDAAPKGDLEAEIVRLLRMGEMSVSELAEQTGADVLAVKRVLDALHAHREVIRQWRGTGYVYLLMPF